MAGNGFGGISMKGIVTAQEMKYLDNITVLKYGVPSLALMENAGREVADIVRDILDKKKKHKVLCVCGKGNNGGDGFVCARHLFNNGYSVDVCIAGEFGDLKKDALINCKALARSGVTVFFVKEDILKLKKSIKDADLIVDALFGTGINGELKEIYKDIIKAVNDADKTVVSIDVPSGIDATTGGDLGVNIQADTTVTLGFMKQGLTEEEGKKAAGNVIIADISLPSGILEAKPLAQKKMAKLKDEIAGCEECELSLNRNNIVLGDGDCFAAIMFIGEGPGANEDKYGIPFCGAAGKILDELLESNGITRKEIYIGNVVKCRPPGNRNPKDEEISVCSKYLDRQIEIIQPKVISCLGNFATAYILNKFGFSKHVQGIGKLHGKVFVLRKHIGEMKIIPLYHPAAAIYDNSKREILKSDFKIVKKNLF